MRGRFFYNADAEMLIVPQHGRLKLDTELGVIEIEPQEIAVIPRGIRFRVALPDGVARGLTGAILARIEAKGYALVDIRLVEPDRDRLAALPRSTRLEDA